MAKTRKRTVSSASGARARKRGASRRRSGTRRQRKLDLRPLKRQIKKNIDTLSAVEKPGARTRAALASLKRVQRDLTKACMPTMVLGL